MCVLSLAWLATASVGQDQDQTLADIRQELNVLYVEIQKLKRELSTTGSATGAVPQGGILDRVNTIESELVRLTSKTEELEFRIGEVVRDGTNRIGDLEFRLVELEGGDISTLGETTTLGGETATAAPAPTPVQPETQLAANEQGDFERAEEALAQGDFRSAADQFAAFNATYPGGPLSVAADLKRGEAFEGLGDTREAARAYLEAFRTDQTGVLAGESLFRLGRALGQLGQTNEACVTLGEAASRFPGSAAAAPAQDEMQRIGCN